ncbi:MBOAT family O-acyltransferase [Butyrivibrio sp. INlla14]|uniref:MBOAT family O-acyltransferase n=1 Tax=Butyrivibrio sp. INlla14 TaxID=1520808 RepID=UPI0008764F12|nr:MBOAT family O-acyltransferase [Butyrivibrio sp. INlla14]SCY70133.1 D-alanyl-lipoteichoic acid acyltransferase DltB, MBOAT superfamily [Butyrivibrio sp. INlla14]
MAYLSIYYYAFVVILLIIYYCLPLKRRWVVLLVGSLGFYWNITRKIKGAFIFLLVSAFLCWLFGRIVVDLKRHKKLMFFMALLLISMPLVLFKEASFISIVLTGNDMPDWWIAPLGLSFFTLQMIAYLSDIYNKRITSEDNFFKFLLFVCFFPQIVQGPIPRYEQLMAQLTQGHKFSEKNIVKGFLLVIWGFFLKLCIADKAGVIVNTVFDSFPTFQGIYVLVAGVLYSIQLYADFLSCTVIAQGVAGMFGIELIDNFKHPYFATSISDFWRRWHISLSSWLRDYIYIPLGGNRKGTLRKMVNLIVTFLVSGAWHGGGVKYLAWGMIHGCYQILSVILKPIRDKISKWVGIDWNNAENKLIRQIFTFFLVAIAWIIFRADHLETGMQMIKSMFTVHNIWILTDDSLWSLGLSMKEVYLLILCIVVLISVSFAHERGINIRERVLALPIIYRWTIYIMAIVFIIIFGTYGYGFDSQMFIYGGF